MIVTDLMKAPDPAIEATYQQHPSLQNVYNNIEEVQKSVKGAVLGHTLAIPIFFGSSKKNILFTLCKHTIEVSHGLEIVVFLFLPLQS